METDFCALSPCVHGVCSSLLTTYECDCTSTGKTGPSCADEVDDCLSGPCSSRGTQQCSDGADAYACVCAQGFTGEHCDTDEWAGSQVRAYISGCPYAS